MSLWCSYCTRCVWLEQAGQYLGSWLPPVLILIGLADVGSPCLALVYTEEVESICLLVCQTLLPSVLRCVTERWREMEAGLAE